MDACFPAPFMMDESMPVWTHAFQASEEGESEPFPAPSQEKRDYSPTAS